MDVWLLVACGKLSVTLVATVAELKTLSGAHQHKTVVEWEPSLIEDTNMKLTVKQYDTYIRLPPIYLQQMQLAVFSTTALC
jgi:hypothetical protein